MNLTQHQHEYLQKHGRLLIAVPMVPEKDHHKAIKHGGKLYKPIPPHRKGDVVYASSPFEDKMLGDVPTRQNTMHRLTITTELMRIWVVDITEEQAEAMGSFWWTNEEDREYSPQELLTNHLQTTHPRVTHAWLFEVELKKEGE